MWRTDTTEGFDEWFGGLEKYEQDTVIAAIEVLEEEGPSLGRPLVDTLEGSRFKNMKELRPLGTYLRVIFIFDPRRMAVLLYGGDKENNWKKFYKKAIPIADRLFEEHLENMNKEEER